MAGGVYANPTYRQPGGVLTISNSTIANNTAAQSPADFPIQSVDLDMNYDFTKISGQDFLLPLKSEIRSREGRFLSKNETEFRMYNRFGADTTIQFGDVPDALPDDATKEQPAK